MSSIEPRRASQGRRTLGGQTGFTLLEVLAAALIMAMFYGVLTSKGVEGFAIEGDAERRLRASLVADRYLVDLETAVANGTPPAMGTREQQEDRFAVRLEVGPLDLPLGDLQPEAEDTRGRGSRPDPNAPPNLLSPDRGQPTPLLQMRVTVAWNDGVSVHQVERTTFAIDPEAVAEVLSQSGLAGATDADGNPIFGGLPGDAPTDGVDTGDDSRSGNSR